MANPILIKASAVASAVPAAASLTVRELALNTADGRLFTKTGAGTVVEFARKDQVSSMIQVGGANLIKNSTTASVATAMSGSVAVSVESILLPDGTTGNAIKLVFSASAFARIYNCLRGNDTYSFSTWHRVAAGTASIGPDVADGGMQGFASTTAWQYHKQEGINVSNYSQAVYNFIDINCGVATTLYLWHPMLELGNKASDWFPAVEDLVQTTDSRLTNARAASDVYAWAKAASKPSYTAAEVGLGSVNNTADSAKSVSYAASSGTVANTNLGAATNPLTSMAAPADWGKPSGYQTMVAAGSSVGLPAGHGQSHFGYTVTSRRDTGGGYSAMLTSYDGTKLWFTYNGVNTVNPTWVEVLTDKRLSITAPAALGTAAVGTSLTVARSDHVHQAPTTITGNAATATGLSGGLIGQLPYQSAANTTAMLAAGTAGYFLKSNGAAAPSWKLLDMTDIPGSSFKATVRVATTANITLSAPQTVDGVVLVAGDRVLVKNQTAPAQNGIYLVAAAAWTRPPGADSSADINSAIVNVDLGTTNCGKTFANYFKSTDTLGTTAMPWYQVYTENDVSTTTTNNVANKICKTDASGYANFGWINTLSGTATGTLTRVYCSQDAYLRYLTPTDFMTSIGAAPKASPTFTGTVTAPTFSGALTGNASGSAGRLESADTRAVADTPQSFARGLEVDFKTNTTDGLGDGGTYHAVMTVRGYADWSGGGVRQVGFTDNHNLWVRGANADTTWGAWRKLAYADTVATASALGGVKVGPGLTIDGAGVLSSAGGSEAPMLITANTAAVAGSSYVLMAALTLTLPATPPVGSVILFQNASGAACTIARNGQPIMTLAEDLTLDLSYTSGKLVYTNATQGWLLTDMSATQVTATANADYATTSGTATNLTGFTSSKSSNPVAGADSLTNNGIGYVNAVSLLGQVDGALYAQAYSTSYVHQVFGDYRTGQMAVRGKNNGAWQAWRTVLDSTNYTSYAPTKTGAGASGSWAISVTGSAASITGVYGGTLTSAQVTTALGYTPFSTVGTYGGTLTSSQVTSALGYTPSNPGGLTVVIASSSITATAGTTYVLTASLTLTLPASPSAGAMVNVSNRSGVSTCMVARNGQNIMGLAEDMTLDTNGSASFVFADATRGWVLL